MYLRSQKNMNVARLSFVAAVVWSFVAGCSSDGGASPCSQVCDCVVRAKGASARSDCESQCARLSGSSDDVANCQSALADEGVSECQSTCSAFAQSSSGKGVDCKLSGQDDDCDALGKPRKFDCTSASTQRAGISLGCSPEHADDATDFDLCCPTSVDSSSATGSGGNATLANFCAKCASCVTDSTFAEGFCTPFQTGTSFNTSACSTGADTANLDTPVVAVSVLNGWTCAQFDDNE